MAMAKKSQLPFMLQGVCLENWVIIFNSSLFSIFHFSSFSFSLSLSSFFLFYSFFLFIFLRAIYFSLFLSQFTLRCPICPMLMSRARSSSPTSIQWPHTLCPSTGTTKLSPTTRTLTASDCWMNHCNICPTRPIMWTYDFHFVFSLFLFTFPFFLFFLFPPFCLFLFVCLWFERSVPSYDFMFLFYLFVWNIWIYFMNLLHLLFSFLPWCASRMIGLTLRIRTVVPWRS
jgi:hypothetical protein